MTTTSRIKLSPEQELVKEHVVDENGNAIIEAVAGSGKTSTLVEVCLVIPATSRTVFSAFNKKIAVEIGRKLAAADVDSQAVKAATFHALGLGAWRRAEWQVEVEARKTDIILDSLNVPLAARPFVRAAVSIAKQSCIGVGGADIDDPTDWMPFITHYDLEEKLYSDEGEGISPRLALDYSIRTLAESIKLNPQIVDFDDMLYAPLLHEARFYTNDYVLVDEAQDTNMARRLMAERMLSPDGTLLAVGDRHQAIYGFTGADADALDLIQRTFNAITLPLTVSWRCASSIIAEAQKYVPRIQAAPDAPAGLVQELTAYEFSKLTPEPSDVILCRNTKPLVELALGYLRKNVPCIIEGRDIGAGLIELTRKWKRVRSVSGLRDRLAVYLDRQTARLAKRDREGQVALLRDKVDALYAIADQLPGHATPDELRERISFLFADTEDSRTPKLTLSTVHKAKGREWDRVYIYGRNTLMPSKWAKQPWELEQEKNLLYVAITRAKRELVSVNL